MPKINYNIAATSYCHGGTRALSAVKYIVLHYTAVNGDTAKNEATYFSRNYSRYAGAHFFVDQSGYIAQSIGMNVTAWSVGGSKYSGTSPQYYGSCTNYNSVSIEMCDQVNKDASAKQIEAVKWLITYIKKSCPNAKTIIRHYDVNGKPCPARYLNSSKWNALKKAVTGTTSSSTTTSKPAASTSYKVWVGKVTASALNVRTGPGAEYARLKAYPQLGRNNLVDVLGTAKAKDGGTWYKIRIANKHIGYVNSAYLKHA